MSTGRWNQRGFGSVLRFSAIVVCFIGVAAFGEDADLSEEEEAEMKSVRDPVVWVNRGMYHVNDKLYFWVLKPLATGYETVLPESVREGVRNMFSNLSAPKRVVNCLLQGKVKGCGEECSRFVLNSTVGGLGYRDVAYTKFGLKQRNEDFGQTLGVYGVGYGLYLTLPLFGPSNARDAVGLFGDMFLDPLNYAIPNMYARIGVKTYDRVNATSLRLGEYEESKELAFDHYISLRESYTAYRDNQVRK